MSRPPPTRPRAWGAPPEPYDPDDGGLGGDAEDAPRRPAPSPRASGSLPPVTLALGLIVLVFGLVTIARRWKWVSGAMNLHRVSSGTRDAVAELAELSGFPMQGLTDAVMPYDTILPLMFAGGVLGVLAGVMFSAIGALVLAKSGLAVRPGARGLLVSSVIFAMAHVCDVGLGYRTITMWEDAMRRATSQIGGDERVRAAMAAAYESLTAAATPSLSEYVIEALLWVVPVAIVALWGARHLDSPEVKGPLGLR